MNGALLILRILFVIITAGAAYQISQAASASLPFSAINIGSMVAGVLFAIGVIWIEIKYANRFILGIFTIIVGLLIGFVASYLFLRAFSLIPHIRLLKVVFSHALAVQVENAIEVSITFFLCYMSVAIVFRTQNRFKLLIPFVELNKEQREQFLVLDTSVIIDGRIVNLCKNKLFKGTLVVPKFVLNELQALADSMDKLKRGRGRRGLEILAELQKQAYLKINLDTETFPQTPDVDTKLIALTTKLQGMLITNDYNLHKIAELHQIEVVNLNSVSNALRPPVLPQDNLSIHLIKPGEEAHQGLGYLDDGTVVVVENGHKLVGKTVDITVTNVLQTNMGRMVFGKLIDGR